MKIFSYLLLSVSLLFNLVQGIKYSEEALLDQVSELPGLTNPINFNQFSGYLNLPNSTNTYTIGLLNLN